MGKESMRGVGMGWSESHDQSLSTEQLRSSKMQNLESVDDLHAAAEAIVQNKEGIQIQAGGKTWVSLATGSDGKIRWMLE